MTRYEIFLASGEPGPMILWLRPLLTEWARSQGFKADLRLSRGVVIRTQAEANRYAIGTEERQTAFTAWLQERAAT